ncbi:RDD family protein [Halobacillus shinanisalinarum]|uniref:RDD family protein n=1 Tax=Halobacillus shinanisalinarum TaxID=2932258 RepID=A0ABY4GUP9_9BACI|nr:RDD family protein [Halobacillus shinanisalinarum]UOQ91620.1 RDD family protein [Halobacillus shinanisalinarum]
MYRSVGFWKRLGAGILDSIIVMTPIALLGVLLFGWDFDSPYSNWITLPYSLFLPVLWKGYIVGKRIMGIRIIKVNGNNVGVGTMFMRLIVGGLVYALTLGIGLIVSAFMVGIREDNRSIHDFIAGTYVTEAKPGEV